MDVSNALLQAAQSQPPGDEEKTPLPLSKEQLAAFGNFGGTTDVKAKAAYLASKGLVGANQLLTDHPDVSTTSGIINAQSDWKTGAISAMLTQARRLNLKNPTQIANNREALMASLDPRIKKALTHPTFSQIHPNFWQTFDSVLADQYAGEKPAADLAVK